MYIFLYIRIELKNLIIMKCEVQLTQDKLTEILLDLIKGYGVEDKLIIAREGDNNVRVYRKKDSRFIACIRIKNFVGSQQLCELVLNLKVNFTKCFSQPIKAIEVDDFLLYIDFETYYVHDFLSNVIYSLSVSDF